MSKSKGMCMLSQKLFEVSIFISRWDLAQVTVYVAAQPALLLLAA
jgi:hypothetical protein